MILKAYRFLNLISIDVACGAMVGACFFAAILKTQLRSYGIASLGITVWMIYTLDHLLDSRRLKNEASTYRHQFHQTYFNALRVMLIIAGIINIYMILHVRRSVFGWGLVLAGAVVLYLLLQRWLSPFKEAVGAILYSTGVLLPALSLQMKSVTTPIIFLIVIFTLTALINLVLFSMFDVENDLKQIQSSFVTSFGKSTTRKILFFLFSAQAIFSLTLIIHSDYRIEALILILMNFVLLLLYLSPSKSKNDEWYRLLGDTIFLFPLPYLILHAW